MSDEKRSDRWPDANSFHSGAGSESDERSTRDPSEMSVDHLTQAFANLLGDDQAEDVSRRSEQHTTGPAARQSDSHANDARLPAATSDRAGEDRLDVCDAEQLASLFRPAGSSTPSDVQSPRGTATVRSTSDPVDVDDDDATPVTPASIVEAILFVGHPDNQAISARLIASYLRGVSPEEIDQLVVRLNEFYAQRGYPYEIVSEGAGYRMVLSAAFSRIREAFYGQVRRAKLSQAAIDLLAIVAYRQPLTRDAVETLRGQASGSVLNQLVRRQLLSVEYTSEKPRKKVYRTTARFLELFGLESLDDLPHHEDAEI